MYVWIQFAPRTLRPVADVRERDGLEAQPATRPERPVAGLEERLEVLRADRLEHLDRDDRVVRGRRCRGSRAAGPSTWSSRPAARTRSRGEVVLRLRDGDRGHAAAELAGGVEREAAPAGADLEHVLARREPGPLGHDRGTCCAGHRRVAGRAFRRRRSNRSASRRGTAGRSRCRGRSARRCSRRLPADRVAPQRGGRWSVASCAGIRHQPRVSAEAVAVDRAASLSERRQVGARPQAVHVRLARPELAAEQDPPDGRDIVDADLGARRRFRVAECVALPVGQLDHEQPSRIRRAAASMTRMATRSTGPAPRRGPPGRRHRCSRRAPDVAAGGAQLCGGGRRPARPVHAGRTGRRGATAGTRASGSARSCAG